VRQSRRYLLVAMVSLVACTAAALPPSDGAPGRSASPPGSAVESARPSPSPSPSIVVDLVEAPWARAIDHVVVGWGRNVSVAIGVGDRILYERSGDVPRRLASNEKLLTSMAALDVLGPRHRFRTIAAASIGPEDGVVDGDLWLVGGGDPELDAADLRALAARLRVAGLRRVTGSVLGDRAAFDRGWWAPGWLPGISRRYVTRPTALAWDGNRASDPEGEAAAGLAVALRDTGVSVDGGSGSGVAPGDLRTLAWVGSAPLAQILIRQNHDSVNLDAELVTKALGSLHGRGSTATGAAAIEAWARRRGVPARVLDGSGLSNLDRTSAAGVVTLLLEAPGRPWFPAFFASLPAPGEGTLSGRLVDVAVRAKTGTLFARPTSALSGYVRTADGALAAFSVLTEGLGSRSGEAIEDAVVRILAGADVGAV
jgi:D-alanyl-D-alanine carboxypeptidase/D-alanyl-D-alanine-endopeptidase (penicillin-binding protein 4)